jgi:hypothetical protein
MTYATIQTIEPIFTLLDFENVRGASAYYVVLIEEYPTPFERIKELSKTLLKKDITPNKLKKGREELLERGFIAQTILGSGPEMYIPVNPEVIWRENKPMLAGLFTTEQLEDRRKYINDLRDKYKKNFGPYGFTSRPDITLRYGKDWFFRTLISNVTETKKLAMMVGGLGSFMSPYSEYYERMLGGELKIQALFQNEDRKRIEKAQEMKQKYKDKIEIKFTPIKHGTSRRVLFDDRIAIDARKILSITKNDSEPSYIGTIYSQKDIVKYLITNFEEAWKRAGRDIMEYGAS